jgi:hypothetical protein
MPTNPWKLTTLVLAAALAISTARAESGDWRADALAHLRSAATLIESNTGGGKSTKSRPQEKSASSASKALELTRAAILQLQRS